MLGGAANIDFCKSLGADIVTDYKVEDIFSVLANDSVDVVFGVFSLLAACNLDSAHINAWVDANVSQPIAHALKPMSQCYVC